MGKVIGIFNLILGVILFSSFCLLVECSSSSQLENSQLTEESTGVQGQKNGNGGHGNGSEGHGNDTEGHHEVHRYQVAHLDFQNVAMPFIVSIWIVFASASKMGKKPTKYSPICNINNRNSRCYIIIYLSKSVIYHFSVTMWLYVVSF